MKRIPLALLAAAWMAGWGCSTQHSVDPADLLILNGRVYTFAWSEPEADGTPAGDAPFSTEGGWSPDAQAVAVRASRIVFVGSDREAQRYRGSETKVIDVEGATVLPGLIDSHVHIAELGRSLVQIDLSGVDSPQEAVELVAARAAQTPAGQWILGWGWDEGAWADRYPDMDLLSGRVPDHPVYLKGLHGFAVWGNRKAFEAAGIGPDTQSPSGGEIVKDRRGRPTGILMNRARTLLESALPEESQETLESYVSAGLEAMAQAGYAAVHEAGADSRLMQAFESLASRGELSLRVYAMLSGRDKALLDQWRSRGPRTAAGNLAVRSVKAFYDGALGSRGAKLLQDYSDRPGHTGVSGEEYGFDEAAVASMMQAGFQASIHAIGDYANRATLDFIQAVAEAHPPSQQLRHRIEHAQVLNRNDIPRFAQLQVIASMQPPHAVEDKAWAEDRLGPKRIAGAYAWRALRTSDARLTFNSDLPGSDYSIFYGLHASVTRRSKDLQPPRGWYPDQSFTMEEAIRAYTSWAAYAAYEENEAGRLEEGLLADVTVIDIDPFNLGEAPEDLLQGKILLTVSSGDIVFQEAP